MTQLLALGSAISLVGAGVAFVSAGVLRYRGRPIPRVLLRAACGLLGVGHGFAFILFITDPAILAPFLAAPAYATWAFLRRGNRVPAGIVVGSLGLPGALWWGGFLIQDALDPLVSYQAVLWLWWAPEVALIVGGILLMARGDHDVAAPRLFAKAPAHVRDPAPIGNAILRATLVGPIPIQLLVGVGVAVIVSSFAPPLAVAMGVPWPAALLAGSVIFAVIGVELGYLAIPRRVRRAWEGHAVVASPEIKRWAAVSGTRVPTSVPAMRRWLEQNPDRPELRWARAQILILTGDLVESRAVIERMPIPADWDRFEQEALRLYVDWVEGADPDYDALQRHAETVGESGSAQRLAARGEATIAVARELAASGGDWMAPLIAFRDSAGALGDGVLRNDLRRVSYPWYLAFGLAGSAFVLWSSGQISF
ncbi:MAG: hypothetical protein WED86_00240 [Chloroflexota bacterium]